MISLILLEFLHTMTTEGRIRATEYMNKNNALSFSDFDFEIVPANHTLPQGIYPFLLWTLRFFYGSQTRSSARLMARHPLLYEYEKFRIDKLSCMTPPESSGLV